MWVTLLVLIAGVVRPAHPAFGQTPFPVVGRTAPDFALVDQHGRTLRLSSLRGKIILLNFIYTRCADVCPLTTAALTRVQGELIRRGWWANDVVFVSVTTDPQHDTPPVLARYAQRYNADVRGWHFLTGTRKAVAAVHNAYGIQIRPAGTGLQEHDLPTFVIDWRGVVLGAYGVNPNPEDVLSDLAQLRALKSNR